jgi:hypothetical protein
MCRLDRSTFLLVLLLSNHLHIEILCVKGSFEIEQEPALCVQCNTLIYCQC